MKKKLREVSRYFESLLREQLRSWIRSCHFLISSEGCLCSKCL
ncbi:hypothetical protein E2C01_034787 [Portunus trituberculatus]|uniref:Uncharacterized protein n=1 Tax=Portunus trituberculatus TaxID=210409 RepID=A0A5B7F1G8_PORTR|nr:hypothetical protein [Portunus trituberculatus]